MNMEEEVYPIHLLTEELKNDDIEIRIQSIRRLQIVAKALGPDKTRKELLPFINESTNDDDEVLVALAQEISNLIPYIGGSKYAYLLLEPLETLATAEETVVRDKAVESISIVLSNVNDDMSTILPLLIKRLAEGDWYSSRVSACSLFHICYNKISNIEKKKELRDLFQLLCADDTPMVRRAAAANLGKFASTVENQYVFPAFYDLLKNLAADDQVSIRIIALENLSSFGQLASKYNNINNEDGIILTLIKTSMDERSWRIRHSVAKDFYKIAKNMHPETLKNDLLPIFVCLLQDVEAEVRSSTANNLAEFYNIIDKNLFTNDIVPLLTNLAQDSAPSVRSSVSTAIMELLYTLSSTDTTTNHSNTNTLLKDTLYPLLLLLLRDEMIEVRLNILSIKHFTAFATCLLKNNDNNSQQFFPLIIELSKASQWRIREAVLLILPVLATTFGWDYFDTNLLDIAINGFTDSIGKVRAACSEMLKKLLIGSNVTSQPSNNYIITRILPKIKEIFRKTNIYQERVNIIHSINELIYTINENNNHLISSELINELIELIIAGTKDKIPNVRFVSIRFIQSIINNNNNKNKNNIIIQTIQTKLKPCLEEMMNDKDSDVKYFATIALETIS